MRILSLFVLAASSVAAQQSQPAPIVRLIATPDAKSPPALVSPVAVRQLPNGTLLVNDTQRRQVLLFDRDLATFTIVADSAGGAKNSYGAGAGGIIPYVADSTLLVDPAGLSMFVVDPAGKIARVASVPRSQDAAALGTNTATSPGLDAKGHLVYRGISRVKQVTNGGLTIAQFPDSVDIDRVDLATRRVDTAAFYKISKTNMIVTQTEKGVSVGAEINPVQTIDDWAVLADGSIAIVRGLDYHVDVVHPDGTLTSAPKIPFDWRPLSDDEKVAVLDSAKRAVERMITNGGGAAMMAMHGGGGASPAGGHGGGGATFGSIGEGKNVPPTIKMVSPSALPDYWPPFGQGAAKADADGNLWVRTTAKRTNAIGGPIYDVVDRAGTLTDRIQVPPGRQIIGFGKGGVVYLAAREDGGAWLERTHR
ncbi:MAG TPA: hypothetical protein VGQ56_18935 [Gemmatimonadaceae bacterium]|nr:hypothetical protein [Gemmatimonadaceae bacterium]